jgi:hypothetical protein
MSPASSTRSLVRVRGAVATRRTNFGDGVLMLERETHYGDFIPTTVEDGTVFVFAGRSRDHLTPGKGVDPEKSFSLVNE